MRMRTAELSPARAQAFAQTIRPSSSGRKTIEAKKRLRALARSRWRRNCSAKSSRHRIEHERAGEVVGGGEAGGEGEDADEAEREGVEQALQRRWPSRCGRRAGA